MVPSQPQSSLINKDYDANKKVYNNDKNYIRKGTREESCKKTPTLLLEKNVWEFFRDTIENFDKMKIFKFYFIYNNFDNVIHKMMKKKKSNRSPSRNKARASQVYSPSKFMKTKLNLPNK